MLYFDLVKYFLLCLEDVLVVVVVLYVVSDFMVKESVSRCSLVLMW